tara:strand:- start:369 stop:833 length:465 start_codon:yes stop_codon:yes gene_type:complete
MTNVVLSSILEPKYLTASYKEHILDIYKNKYESSASELGYIVKVNRIKDVISSTLNNNSEIVIESLCDCDLFKPEVGMIVNCVIDMIHVNGIFVRKYEIKILLPSTSNDYEYIGNSFKVGNKEYKIGDNIDVEIVNIRYDKFIYSCIGKLILKD